MMNVWKVTETLENGERFGAETFYVEAPTRELVKLPSGHYDIDPCFEDMSTCDDCGIWYEIPSSGVAYCAWCIEQHRD